MVPSLSFGQGEHLTFLRRASNHLTLRDMDQQPKITLSF